MFIKHRFAYGRLPTAAEFLARHLKGYPQTLTDLRKEIATFIADTDSMYPFPMSDDLCEFILNDLAEDGVASCCGDGWIVGPRWELFARRYAWPE